MVTYDSTGCDALNNAMPDWTRPFDWSTPESIYFTGWKGSDQIEGFVAQWCWANKADRNRNIYVNLPGMQSGIYPIGGLFNIGSSRIMPSIAREELHALIKAGFDRLRELIAEEISHGQN